MRIVSIFLTVLTAILLSACGILGKGSVASSDLPRETSPIVSETDKLTLLADNNEFALDFYKQVRVGGSNLVYSPYSISLATAMIYAGAGGETASQIASVLHFSLPSDTFHPAMNFLSLELDQRPEQSKKIDPKNPMQLEIANALWGQQDFPFEKTFLDLLAVNYGAGVRLMNFSKDPDAARGKINQWVEKETKGKISDVLPPGSIEPATRLVLTNAVYFKAAWEEPFVEKWTADASFTLLSGEKIEVPTMRTQSGVTVRYCNGDGFQVAAIPYKGGLAEMLILLPDEGQYETFETDLDSEKYAAILAELRSSLFTLYMPGFEFTSDFDLKQILSAMGMPLAFDENRADFGGITSSERLFVQRAVHKAYILADEKGTEAAAVTLYAVPAAALPLELHIDRPFMFVIRDIPTGAILFMGRVLNPVQK